MKIFVAALAVVYLCGVAVAQDEKNAYDKLKDAVTQKDANAVKTLEPAALKFAQGLVNAAKPSDADDVKNWQANIDTGKQMMTYTEYALASTSEQPGVDPAVAIALGNMLLTQNAKSQYVDEAFANDYLVALGKSGNKAKQLEGAAEIVKGHPDNIAANIALLEGGRGSAANAEHLLAAAKKPRPESVPEGDWDRLKKEAEANGYYFAGFINGQKQNWKDCDNNMRAAVPMVTGERLEIAYFIVGTCEFKFGQLTLDRTKMESGQKFMQQAAGMKGPYQSQAYNQAAAMKQALGGR